MGEEGITEPGKNDVLSGRGNSINFHPGNAHFRSLVKKYRMEYVACPKPMKGEFSKVIVNLIHKLDPPGKFLKQDAKTKLWFDIGYKKSLDKTRQALREGAPEIGKKLAVVMPPPPSVPPTGERFVHHTEAMPPPPSVQSFHNISSQTEQQVSNKDMELLFEAIKQSSTVFDEESPVRPVPITSSGFKDDLGRKRTTSIDLDSHLEVSQAPVSQPINVTSSAARDEEHGHKRTPSIDLDNHFDKSNRRNNTVAGDKFDLNGGNSLNNIMQNLNQQISTSEFIDSRDHLDKRTDFIDSHVTSYRQPKKYNMHDSNISEMSMSFSSLGTFGPIDHPVKSDRVYNDEKLEGVNECENENSTCSSFKTSNITTKVSSEEKFSNKDIMNESLNMSQIWCEQKSTMKDALDESMNISQVWNEHKNAKDFNSSMNVSHININYDTDALQMSMQSLQMEDATNC